LDGDERERGHELTAAAAAMAGGGPRYARAGATTVRFYSRYVRVVVDSLHVEATGA
jgi:hypothetical protein